MSFGFASERSGSELSHDLGRRLSRDALIVLPDSPHFEELAERWQDGGRPTYSVVVVVATERDVSESVKYANARGLPFLATVGGHGTYYGMGRLQNGMAIYLRNLTQLKLDRDGRSALVGGGLRVDDVIKGLWKIGKQTVTGSCNCVGITSPALGGGHGFLQGQYGLLADQILSARVVLANGSAITVSDREHKDLYWGLRGAGHNFGIVTEMKYKVYDVVRPQWSYVYFTFSGTQIEELYGLLNRMMFLQPAQATHWSLWLKDAAVDTVHPVISHSILFNGPLRELEKYAKPLYGLKNVGVYSGVTDYPGLADVTGYTVDGYLCQYKGKLAMWPSDVETYEVPAIRRWYDLFDEMVQAEEALSGSFCLLEGYSTQAVRAVPADSTAYPHRRQKLLLAPIIHYMPTGNQTLEAAATNWGSTMRTAAVGSNQRRSYVNYAQGNETTEAIYGYEPWRLQKLRTLKRQYDPEGRLSFYAPIA
ncbi:hypothetical protein B0H66DRAFT_577592 [Apodospora peruviana]|uniref:FAD-binding PCMH-type domain-containing protein n=1 Tax=Apodospora peruviana TaxID=516989 RepID=A0AAE0HVH0_9PEZI|nr:hypothetical protein B0H66DRAFT_577592 [Apodospora peruviana]